MSSILADSRCGFPWKGHTWGGESVKAVGWLSGAVHGVPGVGVPRHRQERGVCSRNGGSNRLPRSG